ncbi:hypothetical protein PO909_015325 [Leuciscus waleckii]
MWWFLPCIFGFIRLYLDGVKVLLYQLFNKSFNLPDLPKQNGKVAIVTGGTRGMGYEISRHLVSLDMHVIIAGNNEEDGLAAVKKIQELNQGKGDDLLHHDLIPLNLQLNGIIFLAMFGLLALYLWCQEYLITTLFGTSKLKMVTERANKDETGIFRGGSYPETNSPLSRPVGQVPSGNSTQEFCMGSCAH